MDLAPRLNLMNWLVNQGLTGLPETDLIRGFCERSRAGGLDISRASLFIDTLHPIFEGRGFRWNDTETNESDMFEYGSTSEGEAALNWRRSIFYHMLESDIEELEVDFADRRKGSSAFRRIRAPVRRSRHARPDGQPLFLLGDAARRRL
jgi:adenylate cyclase